MTKLQTVTVEFECPVNSDIMESRLLHAGVGSIGCFHLPSSACPYFWDFVAKLHAGLSLSHHSSVIDSAD